MANQAFSKFDGLRELGSVRFNSTGSANAAVDRIFAEVHEIPTAGARPHHAAAAVTLMGFTFGQAHPGDAFVFLVGAELVAMNDRHELWQLLWRVDMQAWAIAAGVGTSGNWWNLLKLDGYSDNDEYGDDSTTITWRFDVVNPANYVKAAKNSAHPDVAAAVLVSESVQRSGFLAHVTRRYEKLAALVDFIFDPETMDPVTITRQIVHSVSQPSAPSNTSRSEVSQRALGTAFSLRVTEQISGDATANKPTPYDRWHFIDYEFPRLLTNIITYSDGGTPTPAYKFEMQVRKDYVKKVPVRIFTDFHFPDNVPNQSVLFQLQTLDWKYDGFTLHVDQPGIITNQWFFSDIGGISFETWTGRASTPLDYDHYVLLVGDEVLINERIMPWRYNLWKRERYYIVLE